MDRRKPHVVVVFKPMALSLGLFLAAVATLSVAHGQVAEPCTNPPPPGGGFVRQSPDGMAPTAADLCRDWGDAPELPYKTKRNPPQSGANHFVPATGATVFLGLTVDTEADGQPNHMATGDGADEDGIKFNTPIFPGQTFQLTAVASVAGKLSCWIDYNDDGDWTDVGEQVCISAALTPGSNILVRTAPPNAKGGRTTFARFRFFTTNGGVTSTGPEPSGMGHFPDAPDGEVEDYVLGIHRETCLCCCIHAMLVFDESGSMTAGKMMAAKQGAVEFVGQLCTPPSKVGIVSFSGGPALDLPLTDSGSAIVAGIAAIAMAGAGPSDLAGGIQTAQSELALVLTRFDGRVSIRGSSGLLSV